MMPTELHECVYCHNTWTVEEGFNLVTKQCAGCQEWDDTKEERDAKYAKDREWREQNRHLLNIPYVAGDPCW